MMLALMMMAESPLEHVVQHPLIQTSAHLGKVLSPGDKITVLSDQITMMIVGGLLLILFIPMLVGRRRSREGVGAMVPTGFANFLEAVCEYLRKEIAQPNLHEHTDRFIKYIWTVFFFILTMNLLGLLPVAAVSKLFHVHLGGTATGNVWVTGTMAMITLVMMVVNGLRIGKMQFISHFCPGPLWLAPILVPVEIVGLFAKIFALTVRLFANMLAGHILLAVLLSFILSAGTAMGAGGGLTVAVPVIAGSVAITLLEIFVAFLQAFIFTFLTTLFIGQSVVFHHHSDDHHRGEAAAH